MKAARDPSEDKSKEAKTAQAKKEGKIPDATAKIHKAKKGKTARNGEEKVRTLNLTPSNSNPQPFTRNATPQTPHPKPYRGTSLIRNNPTLGPYSGSVPKALLWS